MAYTVRKLAAISKVSVRTLHFYDEADVLKPAYVGDNGYRYYEEPQLLTLQQILFYRELGFELKQIKTILTRKSFQKVAALRSHRKVLEKDLARQRTLIETIDKTIEHLKGAKKMKSEEMFAGFSVAAGRDRFDDRVRLDGEPVDCKVSAKDTAGAMCAFEVNVGWPNHLHHDQDEWVYVVEGEFDFVVADKRFRARAGESVFIPRKVPHTWAPAGHLSQTPGKSAGKVLNVYQPAGKIEEFFRKVGAMTDLPTREQVVNNTFREEQITALHQLFAAYDMDLLPPPLVQ